MSISKLSRRNFNKLTAAAFGGLVAGSVVGCGGGGDPAPGNDGAEDANAQGSGSMTDGSEGGDTLLTDEELLAADMHVCRGLNNCMNKGGGGDNACAGQGSCATAEKHDCHEMNACKGQGGCGETVGRNQCKGKGECGVPLGETAWETMRTKMEQVWTDADKAFGDAPDAA